MKREKYDFMLAIVAEGQQQAFLAYQKKHNSISFNRVARAFCMKYDVDYKKSFFVIRENESSEDRSKRFFRALRADWLGD